MSVILGETSVSKAFAAPVKAKAESAVKNIFFIEFTYLESCLILELWRIFSRFTRLFGKRTIAKTTKFIEANIFCISRSGNLLIFKI